MKFLKLSLLILLVLLISGCVGNKSVLLEGYKKKDKNLYKTLSYSDTLFIINNKNNEYKKIVIDKFNIPGVIYPTLKEVNECAKFMRSSFFHFDINGVEYFKECINKKGFSYEKDKGAYSIAFKGSNYYGNFNFMQIGRFYVEKFSKSYPNCHYSYTVLLEGNKNSEFMLYSNYTERNSFKYSSSHSTNYKNISYKGYKNLFKVYNLDFKGKL